MYAIYKVTGPRRRRYLARHAQLEQLQRVCEPHFERGESYYSDGYSLRRASDGVLAFGVTFEHANYDDNCGLCCSPGVWSRTALVCPDCSAVLGGF
jgi:hypothetical protein